MKVTRDKYRCISRFSSEAKRAICAEISWDFDRGRAGPNDHGAQLLCTLKKRVIRLKEEVRSSCMGRSRGACAGTETCNR